MNVSFWWGMLITGDAMYVLGQVIHGKSLYHLLNFPVNLKLLQK